MIDASTRPRFGSLLLATPRASSNADTDTIPPHRGPLAEAVVYEGPSGLDAQKVVVDAISPGSGHGNGAELGIRAPGGGRELYHNLRDFAASLTDHREQRACGRVIRKGKRGSAAEVLDIVKTCKRKWQCPRCAYAASKVGAVILNERIRRWTSDGGGIAFMTLTQMHCLRDSLEVLWRRLESGWSAVTRGAAWARDRAKFGIAGYVRITEIVHEPSSGWNPHYHVVLFLDGRGGEDQLRVLRDSVGRRFQRGVCGAAGSAGREAQDIRPYINGSHEELAGYCFKGLQIRRSHSGSRSPMAILADLWTTGEGIELWNEFVQAAPGRKQVAVSHHLDAIRPAPLSSLIDTGINSTTPSRGQSASASPVSVVGAEYTCGEDL